MGSRNKAHTASEEVKVVKPKVTIASGCAPRLLGAWRVTSPHCGAAAAEVTTSVQSSWASCTPVHWK
eukprot:11382488-Prorocentrum_lima.AAC.1